MSTYDKTLDQYGSIMEMFVREEMLFGAMIGSVN